MFQVVIQYMMSQRCWVGARCEEWVNLCHAGTAEMFHSHEAGYFHVGPSGKFQMLCCEDRVERAVTPENDKFWNSWKVLFFNDHNLNINRS